MMGRWTIIIGLWLVLFNTLAFSAEDTTKEDPYSAEALAMINAKLTIAERNLTTWQKIVILKH